MEEQLSFIDPDDPSLTRYDKNTLAIIMELLEEVTSLSVVQSFLKERECHHSAGSWTEMTEKRIVPALNKNQIILSDLKRLLASTEEYGASHCFLFTCSKGIAASLLGSERIHQIFTGK